MNIIRCVEEKLLSPVPDNHYSEVKELISKVCEILNKDQEDVKILFSTAIRKSMLSVND